MFSCRKWVELRPWVISEEIRNFTTSLSLAATAKALKGDEDMCLAAGCDGYIAKPFTHRQLQAAIDAVFKCKTEPRQAEER